MIPDIATYWHYLKFQMACTRESRKLNREVSDFALKITAAGIKANQVMIVLYRKDYPNHAYTVNSRHGIRIKWEG